MSDPCGREMSRAISITVIVNTSGKKKRAGQKGRSRIYKSKHSKLELTKVGEVRYTASSLGGYNETHTHTHTLPARN